MEEMINRLHQGDCMQLFSKLPDQSIDLVFADPPFNIGYSYDVYQDQRDDREYLDWCKQWIGEIFRVLKPSGAFWLAIGDEYAAELKVIAHREIGFVPRNWVVWYYTFGVNCKQKFTRSHAHLHYFARSPVETTFNADDPQLRVPSARMLVYGDKRANPKGRLPDDTWILRPQDLRESFQAEEDTWYYPRVAGTFKERAGFHGCQMPEQILGRIIRACSKPGDVVLDPFSGSGTTLAVAKKLGRNFLGFELSESYVQQVSQRLEAIGVGEPLLGVEDPLHSVPSTRDGTRLSIDEEGQPTRLARRSSKAKKQVKVSPQQPDLFGS